MIIDCCGSFRLVDGFLFPYKSQFQEPGTLTSLDIMARRKLNVLLSGVQCRICCFIKWPEK